MSTQPTKDPSQQNGITKSNESDNQNNTEQFLNVKQPMIKSLSVYSESDFKLEKIQLPAQVRKNSYQEAHAVRSRSQMPEPKGKEDLLVPPKGKLLIEKSLHVDLKKKPLFIGVTGGTASGKTSVCEIIKQEFGQKCCLIAFDSFYKGLSDEDHDNAENYNFDSPNALDFDLAYEKILSLLRYEDVDIPIYDFATHRRKVSEFETLKCQPLLIFEGILALYEKRFRDLMDLSIFVLTDDDIRLSRRIQRDTAERGRSVEDVLAQYNRFVKTSYDEFIKPTMKYADIIVPKGKSNTKGIEFVVNNLKLQIPQDDLEYLSQKDTSGKMNEQSPQPGLASIKEMISPDPNMEGQISLEKKDLKSKDEKKLGVVMDKLLGEPAAGQEDLSEILIDYLLQILLRDRVCLEDLQKQSQIGRNQLVFNIDNGHYAQAATYFAPELISKEAINQLSDEVKVSCDDILWVYTFVTTEKVENKIQDINGKKSINIVYLLLPDSEDVDATNNMYAKLPSYFQQPSSQ